MRSALPWLCLLLASCTAELPPGEWWVEPNQHNPFSALVTVSHPQDVTAWVEAGEDGDYALATPEVELAAGEEAQILLLELEADSTWDVRVVFATDDERVETEPQVFVTEPLPPGFMQIQVTTTQEWSPQEVVCTNGMRSQPGLPDDVAHNTTCFRRDGTPVWAVEHPEGHELYAVQAMRSGVLAAVDDSHSELSLFDRTGERVEQYVPVWLEGRTRFVHTWIDMHEVIELTEGPWDGALAFLSGAADTAPDGDTVIAYGLVVLDPVAREVLWDWSSHGELGDGVPIDPKLSYDRINPQVEGPDWQHGNALQHGLDPDGGQFFWMSQRHQDWIIKIDVDTDEVVWRLGSEGDFELVDDLDAAEPQVLSPELWMYHQHSPEITAREGDRTRFVVFDNGNLRRDASGEWDWTSEPYSRIAAFELDEARMLAAPTHTLGPEEIHAPGGFYSSIRGDVDLLPGGDRLLYVSGWPLAWMAEVTWPEGEEVWRAEVPEGLSLYRAERYPDLYAMLP